MRKLRQTIPFCFIWITIFFFSCHKSSVDINLKDSKSNRHELEKLIQHYKGDELKLEAVKFLLENIDIHGCYRSSASDSLFQYMKIFFHTHQTKNGNYHRKGCDSLFYNYWVNRTEYDYYPDIKHLSAEYLISQIDKAFNVWLTYWSKSYSFKHFCNYVLPYRISEESLSDWRSEYLAKYGKYLDEYPDQQNNKFRMFGIYSLLNKDLSVAAYNFPHYIPDLPLSLLSSTPIGDCNSYAIRNVALFRSLGLPAAFDFIPQWGNRSSNHAWSVFLPTDSLFFPFGTKYNKEQTCCRFHKKTHLFKGIFYWKMQFLQCFFYRKTHLMSKNILSLH